MKEENHKLQELIKDLECLIAGREERLPVQLSEPSDSLFYFYNNGFSEGLKLVSMLAKSYLNKREDGE